MQNWHTREAVVGPVTGIPAVTVVVGLTVNVRVDVFVAWMVGVKVAWAVAVGDPCCPAQAAVNKMSTNVTGKSKREIFFIRSPCKSMAYLCGS